MNSAAALDPSPQQLLALRIVDRDYALEPGRVYVIGTHRECDIRIDGPGMLPIHARLSLRGPAPTLEPLANASITVNGLPGRTILLRIGDTIRLGDKDLAQDLRVVRDSGLAEILPDPLLRASHKAQLKIGPKIPLSQEHAEQKFQEMLAQELRRAPWLALSLLAHALLVLLLFWLIPAQPVGSRTAALHSFQDLGRGLDPGAELPEEPAVVAEPSDLDEPELETVEQEPIEVELHESTVELDTRPDLDALLQANDAPLQKIFKSRNRLGDQLLDSQDGANASDFREVVARLLRRRAARLAPVRPRPVRLRHGRGRRRARARGAGARARARRARVRGGARVRPQRRRAGRGGNCALRGPRL